MNAFKKHFTVCNNPFVNRIHAKKYVQVLYV